MKRITLLSIGTAIIALSSPALAQDAAAPTKTGESADGAAAEEVVITASKSGQQTLQRAPLAIQAFSGETLKERNVNDVTDLIGSIPGASEGQNQSATSRSYNIRGVGVSGTNGDSPIGYYLDDVPFVVPNFGIAPPIRFLDIDRVEILRGPQGTLYGQGSAGGTFIFHTRDPDLNDVKFGAETSLSNTDDASGLNYSVSGAVSVPIVKDHLAVRVSGGITHNKGYADVFYGARDNTPDEKDANYDRNEDIRAVVLWKPASNIRIRGQFWQFRPTQGYSGGLASVEPPFFQNTGGREGFSRGKFQLYSLAANVDLGDVEITSSTSYLKGNFGTLYPIAADAFFSTFFFPKNFTQEIRMNSAGSGPFHWVIGGQYQDGEGPQQNYLKIPAAGLDNNANNNAKTKNWATFGEISYDLFDGKLVPLVGLRYYHDKRTFVDDTSSIPSSRGVTTWRANLAYLPNSHLTMFVTAATGFRAGIIQSQLQANALLADGVPTSTSLRPETLTNYELGAKWRSPSNAISIGANLYRIEFKDVQTSINSSIQVGGYANLGDAHTNGIDLEVTWNTPLKGLSFRGVGNVNTGEFDDVESAVTAALPIVHKGGRMTNSVRHNYQLSANYNGRLTSNVAMFSNLTWSRFGNRLMSSGFYTDPYSLIGATIGVRSGPWELTAFGENLTDERGPTFLLAPTIVSGPRPRTIGLRLRANFQ
ncbi:MAG TPA: TonB-dependent receptor [Sphingomonas sp.]|nr:TonB-dependent receptor [Sphingomonas sp.]